MRISAPVLALAVIAGAVGPAWGETVVVPRADITLQPLNPLRGDLSPKAGVLWGDIKQDVPTGTLIEFVDGFSSPPHIHNITYRGVVITGAVHNDDPDAAKLWMEPGSFWTQPAGENHITAALPGARATAFLEILSGPYLVQPAAEAFDNGERAINVEARNLVWLSAADTTWIQGAGPRASPEIVHLWGSFQDNGRHGAFLRLPAGEQGALTGGADWLRAVVIRGTASLLGTDGAEAERLDAGSYVGTRNGAAQAIACRAGSDCVIYISATGRFSFIQEGS